MTEKPYDDDWYDIDAETYQWSVKIFRTLKKILRVNVTLHGDEQIQQGDIFLFNHFSRFETFIPQFLIYEKSRAYCCSIASAEFFEEDGALSAYLKKTGAIPHDHPRLFPLLAAQILRGRKAVIFPEGCMVKDRRVIDSEGRYSIFSRIGGERRRQHTGAAVLAQGLDAFKAVVRNAYHRKNHSLLQRWQEQLGFESLDRLLSAALKPTLIVPANITFYPIRSSENILHQAVELFAGDLSLRQTEELLIEGNILLKDTDMDLRMGKAVNPFQTWHRWSNILLKASEREAESLDGVFEMLGAPKNWKQKLLSLYCKKSAQATRNAYMEKIYANVTINLSHLASTLIMYWLGRGLQRIDKRCFYHTLYVAIKRLQQNPAVNLHLSLLNPEDYSGLPDGRGKRLEQFICLAETGGLIAQDRETLSFLPKLQAEYGIDAIRMENAIAVYNNEAAPISAVRNVIVDALQECGEDMQRQMAQWLFEDECLALRWSKRYYAHPRFDDINRQESADADAEPFLFVPEAPNGVGVLLIHGLLGGPAELKGCGEYLLARDYTVLGVRLKGHGTSPYDLREQSWESWYASVQTGHTILRAYCKRIVAVGFATGGALALHLAAACPDTVQAVIAAAVPVKFINPAFMLIPLLHGANTVMAWAPPFEGVKDFIENVPEHPHINYRNVPVKSLYELRQLIQNGEQQWPRITAPALILYADRDPVVDIESAAMLFDNLGGAEKQLILLKAEHHGILMDNIGNCWAKIDNFLRGLGLP